MVRLNNAFRVASGFHLRQGYGGQVSRKAVAVVNLWIASRSLPAKAGSHGYRANAR